MRAALALCVVVGCSSPAAKLEWQTDEVTAFAKARIEHKAVLLDLVATWSVPSVELDRMAHQLDATIAPSFVAVRIDVSEETDAVAQLRERYHANALPTILLVDLDGSVLARIDTLGTIDELRATIEDAARKRKPQ